MTESGVKETGIHLTSSHVFRDGRSGTQLAACPGRIVFRNVVSCPGRPEGWVIMPSKRPAEELEILSE